MPLARPATWPALPDTFEAVETALLNRGTPPCCFGEAFVCPWLLCAYDAPKVLAAGTLAAWEPREEEVLEVSWVIPLESPPNTPVD